MNKPEWVYGLHAVNALLGHNPEAIIELYLLSGRDDQRLSDLFEDLFPG